MERQFNDPQLAAIKCAAAHTAARNATAAEENALFPTDKHASSARNEKIDFPFTLVQGPPGTGKTHTVWGVLNVLHFVLYQRYFQHLHRAIDLGTARAAATARSSRTSRTRASARGSNAAAAIRERSARFSGANDRSERFSESAFAGSSADRGAAVREMFEYLRGAAGVEKGRSYGVAKPKILVCAPSNAATDNLLGRVVGRAFRNGDGGEYRPRVVRVGAADALITSDAVAAVTASRLVDAIVKMSPQDWDRAYRKQDAFQKEAASCVKRLESEHVAAAAAYSRHCAECPDGVADVETAREHTRAQDARVAEMLRVCDDRDKAVTEMARFAFCLSRLGPNEDASSDPRRRQGLCARFARRWRHLWWTTPKSCFPRSPPAAGACSGTSRTGSTPCSWTKPRRRTRRRRSFRFCTARGGAC